MMKYKDRLPEETVTIISDWLNDSYRMTFSVKKSNEGTFSPSYSLLNAETGLIVNGKGINEKYALASAYGELCERLFNWCFLRLGNTPPQDLGVKIPEYLELNREDTLREIDKILELEGYNDKEGKMKGRLFLDLLDSCCSEEKRASFLCIPFSKSDGAIINMPVSLCDYLLGTNGMAAGNSYEEAFVQGFSEIVERTAIREFNEGIVSPKRIPEKDIIKDKFLIKAFTKIRNNPAMKIYAFTFEEIYHYPVAFLLLINTEESKFKFKFGSHCSIQYALERCVTELVQGTELNDYKMWISIADSCTNELGENMRIFSDGSGSLSRSAFEACFIGCEEFYSEWNPSNNFDGYEKILKMGLTIYVKMNNKEPINTLQIYIPKWSFIHHPTTQDIIGYTKCINVSRELMDINNGKKLLSEKVNLVSDLLELYSADTKLGDIIRFVCPIQKQFLRRFTIDDIELAVSIQARDYDRVFKYFNKKHNEEKENVYYSYATIKAYYAWKELPLPKEMSKLFTEKVISSVDDDFEKKYQNLLDIDYCKHCVRQKADNCIKNNRKRICIEMSKLYE